ncbi:MAG: hypothetical protein KBG20_20895 [Caldilineaceae bacterium]|nr:hypothetical protein [Caldilineaceae bacterium]MBP9074779.1 hypothetical protein [Caldilineaceae bacterium]
MNRILRILIPTLVLVWMVSACVNPATGEVMEPIFVSPTPTPTPTIIPTAIPTAEPTATTEPTAEPTPESAAMVPSTPEAVQEPAVAEAEVAADSPFADFIVREASFAVDALGVEVLRPGPDWVFVDAEAMELNFGGMIPAVMLYQPPAQAITTPENPGRFLTVATIDVPAVSLRALSRIMAVSPEAGLEILSAEMGEIGKQAELAKVGPYNALKVAAPTLMDSTNYLWIVVRPGAVIYLLAEGFADGVEPTALVTKSLTFLPLASEEVLGLTLLPKPDEAGISADEQRLRLVAIAQQARELQSPIDVNFNFMNESDLRMVLEGDETPTAEERRQSEGEERMLKLLGLIPNDTDLMGMVLDLYQAEIAGYYDDETKEFVLIQPEADGGEAAGETGGTETVVAEAGLDLMAQITFVHEFVHALQDQHLDLTRFGDQAEGADADTPKPTDDARMAVKALIEGDAQFATSLYIIDYVDLVKLYDLSKELTGAEDAAASSPDTPVSATPSADGASLGVEKEVGMEGEIDTALLDAAPNFVRESMIFPYISGEQFVLAIYDKLGWEGVNQVWESPPASTEQILHPDLYPDDLPTLVDLPQDLAQQISTSTGQAWEEYVRNVWGEFQLRLMLAEHLDKAAAITGADGWDGDQFVYLAADNSAGGQEMAVMAFVWDSVGEARAGRTALRTWLNDGGFGSSGLRRFVDEEADPDANKPMRYAFLTGQDKWLYFILATDSLSMDAAVSALGWE